MISNNIFIKNARVHNLKGISLSLPKYKFIVITGLSGSGKSSLAFDTIYAEGQRRYVESLNSYARQFLGIADKPNVEYIDGLSPSISIDQKTSNYNPRSIVGTVTEIYDYFRVMYARIGVPWCVNGHGIIKAQTKNKIHEIIMNKYKNLYISILSPVVQNKKGSHYNVITQLANQGFTRIYVDNNILDISETITLDKNKRHSIYLLIDRFLLDNSEDIDLRLQEAIDTCSKYSNGQIIIEDKNNNLDLYSERYSCSKCDYSIPDIEPRLFSFNSPLGSCKKCEGLGIIYDVNKSLLFNFDKTILEGGIEYLKNLVNSDNLLWQEFTILCKKYNISLNEKIGSLSKKDLDIILNGSKNKISYELISQNTDSKYKKNDYIEGIGSKIKRLYNETESENARTYYQSFMSEVKCNDCNGNRLGKVSLSIKINDKNIFDLCNMSIERTNLFLNEIKLNDFEEKIISNLVDEIKARIKFLMNVGLGYLTLSRTSSTLSGGEFQRIRLATQLGSRLTGILYVLDEPSIGLHQSDNSRLINILKTIRDLGNTIIVVEHDEETIIESDFLVEIGPKAGVYGGEIVDIGDVSSVCKRNICYTAKYLNGDLYISNKNKPKKINKQKMLKIIGARENNLQNINVDIPLNLFICVTGVSGSGKSTLLKTILYKGLKRLNKEKVDYVGKHTRIENYNLIDKAILVSQQSIGKTSRSNPATYVGVFTEIRNIFAKTIAAKERGYNAGKFSFNLNSGRCEKCWGKGELKISMLFMSDVYIKCDECNGKRYKKEVLQIYYKEKNIADVLDMTVDIAYDFFKNQPKIAKKLLVMKKVGLGYIKLNQPSPHLSGGESQRIKLSYYLLKPATKKTLYILDEPTTGLHFHDIKKLMIVLRDMINRGDSIIIIEHNLDVIKMADYIIDLGPGGGEHGGKVIATGTPNQIIDKGTETGKYLAIKLDMDNKRIKNE